MENQNPGGLKIRSLAPAPNQENPESKPSSLEERHALLQKDYQEMEAVFGRLVLSLGRSSVFINKVAGMTTGVSMAQLAFKIPTMIEALKDDFPAFQEELTNHINPVLEHFQPYFEKKNQHGPAS